MRKLTTVSIIIFIPFMLTGCGTTLDYEVIPTIIQDLTAVNTEIVLPSETALDPTEALPTNTLEPKPPPTDTPNPLQPVDGIILFIGDGMGPNQRLGAQWLMVGQDGKLWMDLLSVQGWQQTATVDSGVTDSAAAATALATGVKTRYLSVGVDKNGDSVPTILEQAKQQGWSVGLITTVQMAHATPAGFAAHDTDRDNMTGIALQIMDNRVDVLLGGGEGDFIPRGDSGCHSNSGNRNDGRNLIEEAVSTGYVYVCSPAEFAALDFASTSQLIGFFGDEEMLAPVGPTLAEMTRAAIEILSQNPNGFFLMVEGGQIDWAGHDSEAEDTIQFVAELDQAVLEAVVYYGKNENTLIIVTADHETGGMQLLMEDNGSYKTDGPFDMPDATEFWVNWQGNGSHTGIDVQVSAQGPYAEYLAGTYPNTFIYEVMYAALMGIKINE